MNSAKEIADQVMDLYERYGRSDYIGEPVSQIEHMVQAGSLAIEGGYDVEVILAAFLHDIGHLVAIDRDLGSMDGFGGVAHEKIGADYLRSMGFSEKIASLVECHVTAKRYLTYKYPEYYQQLSEASRETLVRQGGKMNEKEAEAFEKDPLKELKIQMRKWDELAKVENQAVGSLEKYRRMMEEHLAKRELLES